MQLTYLSLRRVDQAETADSFTNLLAFVDIQNRGVAPPVTFRFPAHIAFLVVESKWTGLATKMSVLHVSSVNFLVYG